MISSEKEKQLEDLLSVFKDKDEIVDLLLDKDFEKIDKNMLVKKMIHNQINDNLEKNLKISCDDALKFECNEKFDIVLIDAPCSASGTFRRHPEIIHTKTFEDVKKMACIQEKILEEFNASAPAMISCLIASKFAFIMPSCKIVFNVQRPLHTSMQGTKTFPRYHPYSQGFKEDFGQLHFDLTRLHVTGYNCSRLRGSGGKFESVSELKAAYSRRLPLSERVYFSTGHHQCQI